MAEPVTASPANDLADRFWEWFLEREPLMATVLGDERHDDRLSDPSAAAREEEKAVLRGFLDDATRLERDATDVEERITLDMLAVVARIQLRRHEGGAHHLEAIDQMAGPQMLPGELSRYQRVDSPERVERLVGRLKAFPAFLSAHRDNLDEGLRAGRTAARVLVGRVEEQTRRMVDTPLDEQPLLAAHPDLDEASRGQIRAALEAHVMPALAEHAAYVATYLPSARTEDGLWALPGGDELYATLALASTTIEASPQELHDYGREQLASIDAEQSALAAELGLADVPALRVWLTTDPQNTFRNREEIVELARRQIDSAYALAPQYFGRLPRASVEVRAVEPFQEAEAPPAFYAPPAPDGSRGGIYFINTFQPQNRPSHRIAAATFHEAVPGHHFQIAIESELEGLPRFRTLGGRLAGMAYPEGWGLYAERLADEMGLYDGPRERMGMLDAQAWRAARLVVDTGIHALRWTRQQSVDLLVEVGLSQLEAETETDRYIAWPGQALAYMTGMREIVALRRELEARDLERFDLCAFHDAVLGHGSLPLATLRRELPGWVTPR
ncbi:hypothetical protein BH23CHL7_BH23CHL7_00110 [soil metagenome]